MKIKQRHIILGFIFILYLAIRLYFSLQDDSFRDTKSYLHLRQIENIKNTGKPISYDNLSYGGRTFIFMPLFYYLFAFFYIFFPKIIFLKLVNNLLASTIIIAVYLVSSKVIKNRMICIVNAIIAATIPIYIKQTLNDISPISIIFPGSFFLIYLFINLDKRKDLLNYLIPVTLLLVLMSSSIIFVILGLIIYIILTSLEKIEIPQIEKEYTIFLVFFFLWSNFIIYKIAFQKHGFSIIWSNIPFQLLNQYYLDINLLNAIASIGILPFIFGIYTVYKYLFKIKSKDMYLFISLFLSSFVIFWSRIVPADVVLIFMGASLVILFGQFLKDYLIALKNTKFQVYTNKIMLLLVLVLIITQILPGVVSIIENSNNRLNEDYINGFTWLRNNTLPNSTVLASPEEGHLITFFGNRKNVMDNEYLLTDDAENRLKDISNFYTSKFKIEAIRILEKYNIDYIIVSDITYKEYDIQILQDKCFSLIYNKSIEIYEFDKETCEIRTV